MLMVAMSNDAIKQAIIKLISENYGEKVGKVFSDTSSREIFPIFIHNSFLLLRDLVGKEKAKQQLDSILNRYDVVIPYE